MEAEKWAVLAAVLDSIRLELARFKSGGQGYAETVRRIASLVEEVYGREKAARVRALLHEHLCADCPTRTGDLLRMIQEELAG